MSYFYLELVTLNTSKISDKWALSLIKPLFISLIKENLSSVFKETLDSDFNHELELNSLFNRLLWVSIS